jgi:hypothetical protein
MKHHLSVAALVLSLFGRGTNATCMTIDSTDFRIWGDWHAWLVTEDPETETREWIYTSGTFSSSRADGQPLSASVSTVPAGHSSVSCSIDSFNLDMRGDASNDPGDEILIQAEAITRFHTDSTQLAVTLTASWRYIYGPSGMDVTLRDVTTSTTLLYLDPITGPSSFGDVPYNYSVAVDPSHEYELALRGFADLYAADFVDHELHAEIVESPVPDCGNTSLLLGVCLPALFWAKRRFLAA